MKLTFIESKLKNKPLLLFADGKKLSKTAKQLDKISGQALSKAIETCNFEGKMGQILPLISPPIEQIPAIIICGLKDDEAFPKDEIYQPLTEEKILNLGGDVSSKILALGLHSVAISLDETENKIFHNENHIIAFANGIYLRNYHFHNYLPNLADSKKPKFKEAFIISPNHQQLNLSWKKHQIICDSVFMTRDLVSEPPCALYPESFAERIKKLSKIGLEIEIFNQDKIKELKMGALLGVAQGSCRKPYIAIMKWMGGDKKTKPLAFIGKGVTFDSGGLSLKSAKYMEEMKMDMGGAAVTTGIMRSIAARKAKVNAIGIVGLVENMPSSTAQKPGDIVTSMSGKTIEILNTDAEGRLLLADLLHYTKQRFKPQIMVNFATLTGAILVCLGEEYAGIFCNNDELAARLYEASRKSGEKLWRLPLRAEYGKLMDSDVADVKNIAGKSGQAGAITAAQFLKKFVSNDTPWAHLDIAGVTFLEQKRQVFPKGASGFGVRLINRLIDDYYL